MKCLFCGSNLWTETHIPFQVMRAVLFILKITVQVTETISIIFFADTGQSERKSEGNIHVAVTQFIEFSMNEKLLDISLLHWAYSSMHGIKRGYYYLQDLILVFFRGKQS